MARSSDGAARLSRRHFLGLAALLGAAGTAVTRKAPHGSLDTRAEALAAGYRETAHVREYYRTARI